MKNKNSLAAIWLPLIVGLSIAVGLMLGHLVERNAINQLPIRVLTQQDKISSIISYIESNYVDEIQGDSLNEKLIPEVLKNLDPHSIYLPPRDLAAANETLRGNFDGIGVQFKKLTQPQEDRIKALVNWIKGSTT